MRAQHAAHGGGAGAAGYRLVQPQGHGPHEEEGGEGAEEGLAGPVLMNGYGSVQQYAPPEAVLREGRSGGDARSSRRLSAICGLVSLLALMGLCVYVLLVDEATGSGSGGGEGGGDDDILTSNHNSSSGNANEGQEGARGDTVPRLDERLVFHERFDGDALDRSVWTVEQTLFGGGNNEFQYYVDNPRTVAVHDGTLHLAPGFFEDLPPQHTMPPDSGAPPVPAKDLLYGDCTPYPECARFRVPNCTNANFHGCERTANASRNEILNPTISGRVNTQGKFAFRYGRIEFHARLPEGDWLWPALWMLPEDTAEYGIWPASGEIDIVESRGNLHYDINGRPEGCSNYGSTLHFGDLEHVVPSDPTSGIVLGDGWPNAHAEKLAAHVNKDDTGETYANRFHTFGLVWTDTELYTYVLDNDGEEHVVLDLRSGFANGFWEPPLGYAGIPGWLDNPYAGHPLNAPFDRLFYIVLNVAVGGHGGNEGYWYHAPWGSCNPPACQKAKAFWDARDEWEPTWEAAGDRLPMQVDWIKVWALPSTGSATRTTVYRDGETKEV